MGSGLSFEIKPNQVTFARNDWRGTGTEGNGLMEFVRMVMTFQGVVAAIRISSVMNPKVFPGNTVKDKFQQFFHVPDFEKCQVGPTLDARPRKSLCRPDGRRCFRGSGLSFEPNERRTSTCGASERAAARPIISF